MCPWRHCSHALLHSLGTATGGTPWASGAAATAGAGAGAGAAAGVGGASTRSSRTGGSSLLTTSHPHPHARWRNPLHRPLVRTLLPMLWRRLTAAWHLHAMLLLLLRRVLSHSLLLRLMLRLRKSLLLSLPLLGRQLPIPNNAATRGASSSLLLVHHRRRLQVHPTGAVNSYAVRLPQETIANVVVAAPRGAKVGEVRVIFQVRHGGIVQDGSEKVVHVCRSHAVERCVIFQTQLKSTAAAAAATANPI